MKYTIHGKKVEITKSIRDYINNKLNRVNKYFKNSDNITGRVIVKVRGRDQIIEVTINTSNFTLRNEEKHEDLYAAIDLVVDKLERQITKSKSKMQSKNLRNIAKYIAFENITDEEDDEFYIVKRKKIEMKPMSEEEAILQINMLGHDFYIYKEVENDKICVLYRRKDGNYGVIETN